MQKTQQTELELEALDRDNKVQNGTEVSYGGFIVFREGVKPHPMSVEAIPDFSKTHDLNNL